MGTDDRPELLGLPDTGKPPEVFNVDSVGLPGPRIDDIGEPLDSISGGTSARWLNSSALNAR
jgi:hypothetical protein